MACFIRSSAFLNFLLTTHAWKNENFFFSHHYWIYLYFDICKYPIRPKTFCYFCALVSIWPSRNTVSCGNVLTWTLLLPVWQALTSTRNQMYALDTSLVEIHFNLALCFMFDPQSYNENLFSGQTFTHPIRSHHIQRNMKRSGAWETWRRRAGKIVYQKIKRNESITLRSKLLLYTPYNWKIDGERSHIFEKSSFLDLEPSAMIQNSCHFSPLLILQFGSLALLGQVHQWILNGI